VTREWVETPLGAAAGLTVEQGLGYRAVCLTCGPDPLPGVRFHRSDAARLLMDHARAFHGAWWDYSS